MSSVEIHDKFNQCVEGDLMFVHDYIIFHMVDRCTRWYAGIFIVSKTEDECLKGVDSWIKHHGPMIVFVSDSESGLTGEKAQNYFTHHGIQHKPRAKKQQIPHIDRRGALVRGVCHKITAQLKVEGIKLPFEMVYHESTFVTNAMLAINNYTPYNALYGRVPNLLPPINVVGQAAGQENLTLRHAHRLREIAVMAMVQHTSRLRIHRALKTRTMRLRTTKDYKIGC